MTVVIILVAFSLYPKTYINLSKDKNLMVKTVTVYITQLKIEF